MEPFIGSSYVGIASNKSLPGELVVWPDMWRGYLPAQDVINCINSRMFDFTSRRRVGGSGRFAVYIPIYFRDFVQFKKDLVNEEALRLDSRELYIQKNHVWVELSLVNSEFI